MSSSTRYWSIFAGPTVTFAVGFGLTFDGINIVKLLALGLFAGLALANVLTATYQFPRFFSSSTILVALLFTVGLLIPLFFSGSPIAQQIYGTSGRNLGFLHYIFLLIVLLGFSTLNFHKVWPQILKSLVFVGSFEAIYGALQFFGLDPMTWKNPNKWIFGTFGNPNYLSAFLALSAIASFYIAFIEKKKYFKFLLYMSTCFQSGVILLSDSTQGLILWVFGFFALVLILLSNRSRFLLWVSVVFGCISGIFGALAIFQHGPFEKFLYQESISYRGDYWRAGLRMFRDNWAFGVGLDSYGDYYRMYRDVTAASRRGLDIVSNSAHNLFIDLAATGGILLLLSYISIIALVLVSIFKVFIRSRQIPLDFKLLVALWLAFNFQTLISINVPSLAIWGWSFSGLIIGYKNEESPSRNLSKQDTKRLNSRYLFVSSVCCVLCISAVAPLLNRDVKLANALAENQIPKISSVLLTFPRNADQMAEIATAYEKLGRYDDAWALANEAIVENPNSALAWKVIYGSLIASPAEKEKAGRALKKLDPFFVQLFTSE